MAEAPAHVTLAGPEKVSTYSDQDFGRIAETIGKSPALVANDASRFEAAAAWYRSYCRAPKGILLAEIAKRVRQIANAARKLLRQLEIYDYRKAPDGPGDIALLEFLAPAENGTEDDIIRATAQIGRLVEIFDAIDAAKPELPREGDQYMFQGTEPISTRELLLRLASRPLGPRRALPKPLR